MADNKPDYDLDPDPASTYGKTEGYIEAWNEKYGNKAAEANAEEAGGDPTGVVENAPGIVAEQEANAQAKSEASTAKNDGGGASTSKRS